MKFTNILYVKLVLVQVFWSGTFVASEIALRDQPPGLYALLRYTLTLICYGLLSFLMRPTDTAPLLTRLKQMPLRTWLPLAAMGGFGVTLYTLLLHIGLRQSTATYAALLIPTTQPIFTSVLSRLIFRETVSLSIITGIAAGLVGALLIITVNGADLSKHTLDGNLTIMLAALMFSLYAVSSKFAPTQLTSIENTTFSFLFGTLFLIPMPYVMSESYIINSTDMPFWIATAYLVIFATLLPYLWWNQAVKVIGSAKTGLFTFLMPPLAILMSFLILDHRPTAVQTIGACISLFGVAVATFGFPNSWLSKRTRVVLKV